MTDITSENTSPTKLKSTLKTIIRQDALVIDDSKPIIKKQLSFPDELPHYHEIKSKPERLRRAVSGKSRNGSARRKKYEDNYEDSKRAVKEISNDFHHQFKESQAMKGRGKTKVGNGLKTRSSSAIEMGERKPGTALNMNYQRSGGGNNSTSTAKRSMSSTLSREKDVNIKRSLSVTDIYFKKATVGRKKEICSSAVGKNGSIKTANKSLVKQLSLPETSRKSVYSKLPRQSSVTYNKSSNQKPKPTSASVTSIYTVPKKMNSHLQEHLSNDGKMHNSMQLNHHITKQNIKSLPKFKRTSEPQTTKPGQLNTSNNSNLEDLLAALQVKPASKHVPNNNKQLKVFRSFRDRYPVKGVDSIAEITTMVSDVSPVLSDLEISEQNNSWATPIIGPSGYTHRSNYSKVLRPAFLGRSTSQSSSRESSAKSTKSISPTPPPDMTIINEDNLDINDNLSELETTHTPAKDLTESPPSFQIPAIVIDPYPDISSNESEGHLDDETVTKSLLETNSSEDCSKFNLLLPNPRELLKQERICNSMHKKLKKNGVDVSLQTLQRALMSPTEYRMVHHARRAQSCILSSRTVRY